MTGNKRLRLLLSDHLGLPRGKYSPLKSGAESGSSRFCQGIYALTYARDMIDAPGGGKDIGFPDIEARYKSSDYRDGWEDDTVVVVCDQFDSRGNPFPLCGRTALKKAVAEWQKLGFTPKLGIELEAYIFERKQRNRRLSTGIYGRRICL